MEYVKNTTYLEDSMVSYQRERDVRTHPWQEVAVNLIGPWAVEIRDKWYEFNASTGLELIADISASRSS